MLLHFLATAALLASVATAAQAAPETDRGRRLLAQYRCGSCHAIPGVEGAQGTVAQTLKGWKHRSYIAGRVPNGPDALARWIREPRALVPGTAMPSMGVTAAHAGDMAAYLLSLE